MAIDAKTWKWLKEEVKDRDVLTLGRQHWAVDKSKFENRNFSEIHLIEAGANWVDSLDASESERPSFVHDLNFEVPEKLHGRFDLIFDGGTLEHVFNVPVALESIRRMLNVGGTFCSFQIGNLSGHGFWSISPELFIKWAKANGFSKLRCVATRLGPGESWFEIPVNGTGRIEISTVVPFVYFFRATKEWDVYSATLQQAGPSFTSKFRYWFKQVRLWNLKKI